jgi:hypothetical protein
MRQKIITQSDCNTEIATLGKSYRQIGIRAHEGSVFVINGHSSITIGPTNIYEIDLTNKNSYIDSIRCITLEGDKAVIDLVEKGE